MHIYQDYDQEPEEQFQPLPRDIYSELYDLEMAGFTEDVQFYLPRIAPHSLVLELGCGCGRLSSLLAAHNHRLIGIDLSRSMLRRAADRNSANTRYVCMDMRRLAFTCRFNTVLIPYHTLNLLNRRDDVLDCLHGCRASLNQGGTLMMQLYVADSAPDGNHRAGFQFQIFERPQGGKIIKEIIRKPDPGSASLQLTERYKIRPMQPGSPNLNYSHTLQLSLLSSHDWRTLIESAGFTVCDTTNRYTPGAPPLPGSLFIQAQAK